LSDVIPYLVYYLAPVLARLSAPMGRMRLVYAACFALLVAAGVFVHSRGALSKLTSTWNTEPISVDLVPARLWDWHDLQSMRGTFPYVAARPDQIRFVRQPGEQKQGRVDLELVNLSRKRFRWQSSASPGIEVSPAQGEHAIRYSVSVVVPVAADSLGRQSLGTIDVGVEPDGLVAWPRSVLTIPIDLYVLESEHNVFLPLVLGGAR
jgi:hypothetical protein